MADIVQLQQERNSLNQQIAELRNRESQIFKEQRQINAELRSVRAQIQDPNVPAAQKDQLANRGVQLESQYNRLEFEATRVGEQIAGLERELAQVNAQISAAQQTAALPQQSTGQTAREDQAARADRSLVQNPPPPLEVNQDGRIVPAPTVTPTNAQTAQTGAASAGTNEPVRTAESLQAFPPPTAARPVPPGIGTRSPSGGIGATTVQPVVGDSGPYPGAGRGTAAPGDDQTNGTRAEINTLFGGSQARIVTQPNVLDKYTNYTYNISIYIMSPTDYGRLIRTKQKVLNGFQLLMRSGGAPLSSGFVPQTTGVTDPGEIPGVTTQSLLTQGRNQFFPLDYYIDDLQVRSLVNGKGTGGAHNVVSLNFKLIEPNGITFIKNLRRATETYISNQQGGTPNQNYAAQHFLMVIKFYSYDEQGNLVACQGEVVDQQGQQLARQTPLEKFIPFRFTAIKFRIADRLVEYQCEAVVPQVNINAGARGAIPYNMEIQARTLQELFVGNKVTGGTFASAGAVAAQTREFNPNGVENPSTFQVVAP
jgi:hypothetical protein